MRRRQQLVLGALAVVAFLGCKRSEETAPANRAKVVTCAPVESAMVTSAIEVRGTVAPLPDRDAQVAPQVAGRIVRVDVHEGDSVTAGQVVAKIDDGPLVDAEHQAQAALARARAEHTNARTTLERTRRVFEHGIVARQEVDDAAAKEVSAGAAETEADAALRQAQRQIGRATVRSPLGGVVLKVFRKSGELVDGSPSTAILEVADTSKLELVADVPAHDLVLLRAGAHASLTLDPLPDRKFDASVARVAPSVDRTTGLGTVHVAIAGSDGPPPPVGTFGVAHVESGAPHPATLVPTAAVRSVVAGEGEVIVCGADHLAHVRKVVPGQARDGKVEVRGELGAKDWVVVDPVLGISDGEAIEEAK